MKLYSEQEIKRFMKNRDIILDGEYIKINDEKLNRETLIKSLKELQMKNMSDGDSFSDYRKQTQKNKNKIRKG